MILVLSGKLKILVRRPLLIPFAVISVVRDVFIKPDRTLRGSEKAIDSPAGQWITAKPLPSWRYEFGGGAIKDEIYVIGGLASLPTVYTVTRRVEVYNTKEDRWRQAVSLPVIVHHAGVVVIDDCLYVVGGNGFRVSACSYVFEFNHQENVWQRKANMPTPRGALGVAVGDGLIYAVGGATAVGWKAEVTRGELEVYEPKKDKWMSLEPMPTPREHLAAVAASGLIFALGGYAKSRFEPLTTNEAYNSSSGKWEKRAPLPLPLCGFPAVAMGDSIFIFGGVQGWAISGECCEYNVSQDRWIRRADMPVPRYAAIAVAVGDRIHVIGGKSIMMGYIMSRDHHIFVP